MHLTMIIPDAVAAQVRALASSFGPSASNMWITPLSPTGIGAATHWISAGEVGEQFAAFMPVTEYGSDKEGNPTVTVRAPDPGAFAQMCSQAGIKGAPSQKALAAIFAVCDVSDQDPFAAMARLGLQIARVPLP